MPWTFLFHPEFNVDHEVLSKAVQDELAAARSYIAGHGSPKVGRPLVDTLIGSKHVNRKESRFTADGGVRRVAFAFDPKRHPLVLVAGKKGWPERKALLQGPLSCG